MKGKLNKNTVGLIVGAFMGLWHLMWAGLVAMGSAQSLLDWIYGIHFLNNPFVVASFNPTTAVVLVLFTAAVGYGVGWVFATIWNKIVKK